MGDDFLCNQRFMTLNFGVLVLCAIHYLLLVWFKICMEKQSGLMVTLIKYSILSVAFSPLILESQHKTTEDHKQLTAD